MLQVNKKLTTKQIEESPKYVNKQFMIEKINNQLQLEKCLNSNDQVNVN